MQIPLYNPEYKEIIDGITIVHSGDESILFDAQGKRHSRENVKMYDSYGNSFYSNFESIEEANQAVAELAENGITAVVGPKAPCIDRQTRKFISNPSNNAVGVFIVNTIEKDEDNISYKSR